MAKTEKERIELWRNRISQAESIQKDFDTKYGYTRAHDEYRGEYNKAMKAWLSGVKMVPINEVKAYVKTLLPSIYARDPYIAVNPVGAKNSRASKIAEASLNSYWRELQLKREIKRCIVDAVLGPWGWMKIGYSAVFGTIEPEKGEPLLEQNQFIREEEIFAVRESWRRIVYDPNAINPPHDCRWIAEKLIKPLDAVQNSDIYKNTADLKPSFSGTQYFADNISPREKAFDDTPYVILWEIWDRDEGKVLTVPENLPKFLLNRDWPYKLEGFPFIGLSFDINPDENYPQNLISAWEPQLWEKIKLRSMQLDHLKRFGRQLIADEGALAKTEEDKYKKGISGSIIYRRKGKSGPDPIPYPPIQQDLYAVANAIDLDKDNISGQSNIMRAAPQKTQSRTLGELDRLMSSSQHRNTDPQDIIEDFSEQIGRGLIGLMREFITLPKYVRISQKEAPEIIEAIGPERFDGSGFFYTKEDIVGDYDIDVRAGSTLPMNKENRIRTMSEILKLGPTLGIGPNSRTSKVLGKNVLADLELDEVAQAFEDDLREMEAQREAQMQMAQMRGAAVAQGAQVPGGGRGPAPVELGGAGGV